MFSVKNVAEYILRSKGRMTTWKLQKLVYYSQAWSLVWDERLLFRARIEAWANGPVIPELYRLHRGAYKISSVGGDPAKLDKRACETINAVVGYYGKETSQYLSDLTHMEDPWKRARVGVPDSARSHGEITPESMIEFYESLQPDD